MRHQQQVGRWGRVVEVLMMSLLAAAVGGAGVALIIEGARPSGGQNRAVQYAAAPLSGTGAPRLVEPTTAAPRRSTKPALAPATRKPKVKRATRYVAPEPTRTKTRKATRVVYRNCTHLRQDHPNGVSASHWAYRSKMDRDKDGWACER